MKEITKIDGKKTALEIERGIEQLKVIALVIDTCAGNVFKRPVQRTAEVEEARFFGTVFKAYVTGKRKGEESGVHARNLVKTPVFRKRFDTGGKSGDRYAEGIVHVNTIA